MIIEEMLDKSQQRHSCEVLDECKQIQVKKSSDYQNAVSSVKHADYYPRGLESIYDMMNTKMLRIKSLLETMRVKADQTNFESIEDSAKDLINYASFFVEYHRGKMDGQDPNKDKFNRS